MKIRCKYDELVDPHSLKHHPKNRNKHPDDQIKRLGQILDYQGWRYPIKVSKASGYVTSGHGRILAAIDQGWADVPVNYQEYESEEQEYADVQSDNAIAAWSDLDLAGINSDIGDLGPDFDIDLLGIKDFELDPADKYKDKDDDAVPDTAPTKTKLGQIWKLGGHRLMCGDATKDIDTLLGGEKVDMVYTDPPYGINVTKGRLEGLGYSEIKGDEDTQIACNVFTVLPRDVTVVYWGANYFSDFLPPSKAWVSWSKETSIPAMSDMELAWTNYDCFAKEFRYKWDGPRKSDETGQKRVHPTQKPIALAEWCFKNYGDPKTVLDVFGGSGSTLIACEKTNRKCYMMEIEPKYCDIIIKRWEDYMGSTAELQKDV